jgi:hypothetical protein
VNSDSACSQIINRLSQIESNEGYFQMKTTARIFTLVTAAIFMLLAACSNNATASNGAAAPSAIQPPYSSGVSLPQEVLQVTTESAKSKTGLEQVGELFNRSYYVVWDEAGLRELATQYEDNAIYTMQNDIQLSAEEWIPIGTQEKPFSGWLLGNTYTISGLTMSDPNAEVVGLFGYASDALISDLILREVDISRAGNNVMEESKSVDAICAVRNNECLFGTTEIYLKGSDINIAPKLTEEEKADLQSYINRVLSGNEN